MCFNHVEQIKSALGIPAVISQSSAWIKKSDDSELDEANLSDETSDNFDDSNDEDDDEEYYKNLDNDLSDDDLEDELDK